MKINKNEIDDLYRYFYKSQINLANKYGYEESEPEDYSELSDFKYKQDDNLFNKRDKRSLNTTSENIYTHTNFNESINTNLNESFNKTEPILNTTLITTTPLVMDDSTDSFGKSKLLINPKNNSSPINQINDDSLKIKENIKNETEQFNLENNLKNLTNVSNRNISSEEILVNQFNNSKDELISDNPLINTDIFTENGTEDSLTTTFISTDEYNSTGLFIPNQTNFNDSNVIIGLAISLFGLIGFSLLIYFCLRRRMKKKERLKRRNSSKDVNDEEIINLRSIPEESCPITGGSEEINPQPSTSKL